MTSVLGSSFQCAVEMEKSSEQGCPRRLASSCSQLSPGLAAAAEAAGASSLSILACQALQTLSFSQGSRRATLGASGAQRQPCVV